MVVRSQAQLHPRGSTGRVYRIAATCEPTENGSARTRHRTRSIEAGSVHRVGRLEHAGVNNAGAAFVPDEWACCRKPIAQATPIRCRAPRRVAAGRRSLEWKGARQGLPHEKSAPARQTPAARLTIVRVRGSLHGGELQPRGHCVRGTAYDRLDHRLELMFQAAQDDTSHPTHMIGRGDECRGARRSSPARRGTANPTGRGPDHPDVRGLISRGGARLSPDAISMVGEHAGRAASVVRRVKLTEDAEELVSAPRRYVSLHGADDQQGRGELHLGGGTVRSS